MAARIGPIFPALFPTNHSTVQPSIRTIPTKASPAATMAYMQTTIFGPVMSGPESIRISFPTFALTSSNSPPLTATCVSQATDAASGRQRSQQVVLLLLQMDGQAMQAEPQ